MPVPNTNLAAALHVLGEAQKPMTSDEITDEAIRRGLLAPNGKTPRRTMSACLYTWVKKDPSAPIERIFTPGANRTQRGSVRWRIRTIAPVHSSGAHEIPAPPPPQPATTRGSSASPIWRRRAATLATAVAPYAAMTPQCQVC